MEKFIITWNTGCGDGAEIVEAKTLEDATEQAYEAWREEVENNSEYRAEPYSADLAYNHGLIDDPEG